MNEDTNILYVYQESTVPSFFFCFTHINIGILQDSIESYPSPGDLSNELLFNNQYQDQYSQPFQHDGNFVIGQGIPGQIQQGGLLDHQQASPQQLLVPDQYDPLSVENSPSPSMFSDYGSPPMQQHFVGESTKEDSHSTEDNYASLCEVGQ